MILGTKAEKLTQESLATLRRQVEATLAQQRRRVLVCAGTGCVANGSLKVYTALAEAMAAAGVLAELTLLHEETGETAAAGETTNGGTAPPAAAALSHSGCHGFCEMGPLVRIEPEGILYTRVQVADVPEIVQATLQEGRVIERLLYHDAAGQAYPTQEKIPFYARQQRLTLSECGHLDPEDILEYIGRGGYQALARALAVLTPEDVCAEVEQSGLRGRGGGGFPTGKKWQFARTATGSPKYLVCNGDEGDPGAFMDRSLMEGDPHRLLEGMLLAGYAIGASEGYIYVRAEYPLAVKRLQLAVEAATAWGLLGENILGSDFSFQIHIKEGAGAFVCGEETALLASIEGERGMPRPKPPFPANKGLWGRPTVINNVETLANVPLIMARGAAWFRRFGTATSPGTKTFALTGQVANTGLIEVPFGVTLREIVFAIGGGLREGRKFKAVQIGGPSGGCLTSAHLDLPLDFDSLQAVGAMVGSGGLVVMDEKTCIVEVARFFMHFTQNESCGKCVPCREGTKQMLALLEKIVAGKGSEADLDLLEELAQVVGESSLCGLGKTAPNPVLSTLRYFREEYLAHVREHRCPAGVCKALRVLRIDPAKCKGCGKCLRTCPAGAITGERKAAHRIDPARCLRCGACVTACPFAAIA